MKKIALSLYTALLFIIGCYYSPTSFSAVPNLNEINLSEWNKVDLGLGVFTYRRPLVAVTAQGPSRFVVATVEPIDSAASGNFSSVGGTLVLHEYDLATGFKGSPITISNNYVGFVRGSMNPPINANCAPVIKLIKTANILNGHTKDSGGVKKSLKFKTNSISGNKGYVNYLTFDEKGDFRVNGDVKLIKLLSCPGQRTKVSTIVVGKGKKPSVAIGKTIDGEERILVTYGSNGPDKKLMGQFYTSAAVPVGPPFTIYDYRLRFNGWDTLNTDIIWNPVSKRFIVGFTTERINPFFACTVLNIAVDIDGATSNAIEHGGCSLFKNDNHTWVDIDRNPTTNPDGYYAWYFVDGDDRNIHLMDNLGQPTGEKTWIHFVNEILIQEMFRPPAFAAIRKSTQSPINSVLASKGEYSDHYVTALTHHGNPNEPHSDIPLKITTFSKDGKLSPHLSPKLGGSYLRGIGVLENHTVYIHSTKHAVLENTTNLFLTVRRNSDPLLFQ